MARQTHTLTVKKIENLKQPGHYLDGQGLYLQVSESLSKSWLYKYKVAGRRRELGLGPYPAVSLAEARVQAKNAAELRHRGIDPIQEFRRKREALRIGQGAPTFKHCAEACIAERRSEWKNAKHAQQWTNTLTSYAFPIIGRLPVDQIEVSHVQRVLKPIWASKTETAKRVRSRMERVFDWAKAMKLRSGENPAVWRGNLELLFTSPRKLQRKKHFERLPIDETPALCLNLKQNPDVTSQALLFLILTACRTNEVLNTSWPEIDIENALWTIPGSRTKTKRDYRIPLSTHALALLTSQPKFSGTDLIFPSPQNSKSVLSNMALLMLLRRKTGQKDQNGATVHGFRSTFKDWTLERTDYPNELSEMALGHVVGDKAEAAYRRGDLLDRRRDMMQNWGDFCLSRELRVPQPGEKIPDDEGELVLDFYENENFDIVWCWKKGEQSSQEFSTEEDALHSMREGRLIFATLAD